MGKILRLFGETRAAEMCIYRRRPIFKPPGLRVRASCVKRQVICPIFNEAADDFISKELLQPVPSASWLREARSRQ
jgi:hypothetical protein